MSKGLQALAALAALVALAGASALLAAAGSASPTVTRGPYLQLATPSSAVVRWRTDVATPSRVLYGPAPGTLDSEVSDPAPTTEHAVALEGLPAATRFYYAVGSDLEVLAGGDAEHFFTTAPPAGGEADLRIWVIGDSGTADANAAAVRDAYLAWSAGAGTETSTDVWLTLGDNAYPTGTDGQYQTAVFDTYPMLLRNVFLWPAFGNHDALSSDAPTQSGPYFDMLSLPAAAEAGGLASGTEAYYSFDHGPVHFVCLDSADTYRGADGSMMQWLAADLAATDRRWIVAYFHHPPYTKGSHDSDAPADSGGRMIDMREVALPILEAAGADLVLAGHSHSYERSFLLDGHYGSSDTLDPSMVLDPGDGDPAGDGAYRKVSGPHGGTVYVVAGSSGRLGGGDLDHPAMAVAWAELGSLVLEVDGYRLDGRFLDSSGAVLDHFAIMKGLPFSDGFESGDTSAWVPSSQPPLAGVPLP